jgi:hypothetical protein
MDPSLALARFELSARTFRLTRHSSLAITWNSSEHRRSTLFTGEFMTTSQVLIALIALTSLAGCDTVQTAPQRGGEKIETGTMLPVPAGRGSREDSGLTIAYEFITPNGTRLDEDGMCRLRLVDTASRRSYFIQLDRQKTAAYVALPAGHYETLRMGCGITKTWDVGDIFKGGLQVETGSASYAGKVSFVFQKNQLQVVERASRSQHANGFAAAVGVVPQGLRIVSAYNLVPLTEEMASEGQNASGFDVNAKGLKTGPVLNGLLGQLRQCEPKPKSGKGSVDPLMFGKLDYTAAYQNGKFRDFTSKKDANAFNDQFKSCVAETLSSFRPPTGDVEIHVVY